jgi:hypothetical protein
MVLIRLFLILRQNPCGFEVAMMAGQYTRARRMHFPSTPSVFSASMMVWTSGSSGNLSIPVY